jgi:hypothetical protein
MMKEALNSLPVSLEDAYRGIIKRIAAKGHMAMEQAWQTLTWIFYVARPLAMYELREAITVRSGDTELDENLPHPDDILKVCESLVVWDSLSEVVRSTHYSVQEFLTHNGINERLSRVTLAVTCSTYLAFDAFDQLGIG